MIIALLLLMASGSCVNDSEEQNVSTSVFRLPGDGGDAFNSFIKDICIIDSFFTSA